MAQQRCRLCGNNTADLVPIFSKAKQSNDYEEKIKKYLYLPVEEGDDLPKSICWMCSQQLDSFHRFHEKIHEIQQRSLGERYWQFVLAFHQWKGEEKLVVLEDEESKHDQSDDELSTEVVEIIEQPLDEEELSNEEEIDRDLKPDERDDDCGYGIPSPVDDPTLDESRKQDGSRRLRPDSRNDDDNGEKELPARDSDNEEWPAAQTLEKFPTTIIKNGVLTVKGPKLLEMINQFYNLQCDICHRESNSAMLRYKNLHELYNHYQLAHQVNGFVVCCQSKFYRYPSVVMHMARHLQPDAFKCDLCGYIVTRPRFLVSHKQTHLPENEKPYGCPHCPKRFCWKRALQVHLNTHKPPMERQVYVCPTCDKTYDTPGGLSTHKRKAHTDGPMQKEHIVCDICAKTFSTPSGLKEHVITIHKHRDTGQVQCSQCMKWLRNTRCLKVHMQMHSEVEYGCDQCEYMTKKKLLLKRHIVTHHQQERPYGCDLCDKTFKLKTALTTHMAKHTFQRRSYPCNFCERKFSSSTNFYTHRKNSHPQELQNMRDQIENERHKQRIAAGLEQAPEVEDKMNVKAESISEVQRADYTASRKCNAKLGEIVYS